MITIVTHDCIGRTHQNTKATQLSEILSSFHHHQTRTVINDFCSKDTLIKRHSLIGSCDNDGMMMAKMRLGREEGGGDGMMLADMRLG